MPPRHVQKVYAADKRANAAAADRYFAQQRRPEDVERIAAESPLPDAHLRKQPGFSELVMAARNRALSRMAMADEPTPPHLLHRLNRDNVVARGKAELAERLPGIVAAHRHRNAAKLRSEAQLDSAARVSVGKSPLNIDEDVEKRVQAGVREEIAPELRRLAELRRQS